MSERYPEWRATRSNEDFDRAQDLAQQMTDDDRRQSRPAPACGYSKENFDKAAAIVKSAQR